MFLSLSLFFVQAQSVLAAGSCYERQTYIGEEIQRLLERQRYLDAHVLAMLGEVRSRDCAEISLRYKLLDAHSLWKLGDHEQAMRLLDPHALPAETDDSWIARFGFHGAWIAFKTGDDDFFVRWLNRQPDISLRRRGILYADTIRGVEASEDADTIAHAALPSESAPAFLAKRLEMVSVPSPLFAGLLNAVLPGAGYAHLGMWQSAGISLLLNTLTIGAVVEFAREKMYFAATTAGLLASFFYIGGIIGAGNAAHDIGSERRRQVLWEFERSIFPELALP